MVRDHRVATRSRRRAWRSVSLSSFTFLWTNRISPYTMSLSLTLWYAGWRRMEPLSDPTDTLWPFPFTPQDCAQTPLAVQAYVRALRDEVKQLHDSVETLTARLQQNSTTSHRPPSSDSPYKKPRQRTTATTAR